ncbi:hypothetical protein HN784_00980 [bacterium]|jgi:hypothetical protein|nr:hypothetical protein [bacterium]MBT4251650.1 hypothetical protein [bacterium]MBT4597699.1 hypothetical protein [bacterium]MBT6753712.1 hypothetical protein [bacterium]MBT7037849.1 hypothetical protein [bacterium]
MYKKTSSLLAIVFFGIIFCGLASAADKEIIGKREIIIKTSFADSELPERYQEDSAREKVEKELKAAVIAEKVQHVDYVGGELIVYSSGTLVDWNLMKEYITIEYDSVGKFAKGTLTVPRDFFLKYLEDNVYPGAIPAYYLDNYGNDGNFESGEAQNGYGVKKGFE